MGILDHPTPAGEYKHRVVFNPRLIKRTNGLGEEIIAADQDPGQSGVKKWAAILPVSGEEKINAAENKSVARTNITVRYSPYWTPTAHDSLIFNGRTLNMVSCLNVEEANQEWHIVAEEIEGE
jgi:SPP1 family predicted phage head-tail adaptor